MINQLQASAINLELVLVDASREDAPRDETEPLRRDPEVDRGLADFIRGTHRELARQPPRRQKWSAARSKAYSILIAILLFNPASTAGADLKSETLQQWKDYLKTVEVKTRERLVSGNSFLASDEVPGQTVKLRKGEIVVVPANPHTPLRVQSGLIHDWNGAAFLPCASLDDVLPIVRNYDHYKDFYHPNVIDSKSIKSTDSEDRFSMVLMNRSAIATTALDADYRSSYTRLDAHRWYSVTDVTRIQEISDYASPAQRMLPEDQGTGLIWRLHSVTRFEERDGGIYIEVEAVALSRDIPVALRWMVDPIVRRISRSSLITSLQQTESAVRSHSESILVTNNEQSICVAGKGCKPQITVAPVTPARSFR